MTASAPIDIPRLLRIVTLLFAILAGAIVDFAYEPRVDALQQRVDDAQAALRSDEIAFSEIPQLRLERASLARRYGRLFAKNPEAVFLRELSSTAKRHDVTLITTSFVRDPASRVGEARQSIFSQTRATIELRGTYRHLLEATSDLSAGSEIVAVDAPSLHRDGTAVTAIIPITIYELSRPAGVMP